MQLTTKCRYAVQCLVKIANQSNHQIVSVHTMSDELNLSFKYLENIFFILKTNHVVIGTRGPRGGYRLTKDARDISLYDVFKVCETNVSIVDDSQKKTFMQHILEDKVWNIVDKNVENYLSSISIQDIVDKKVVID